MSISGISLKSSLRLKNLPAHRALAPIWQRKNLWIYIKATTENSAPYKNRMSKYIIEMSSAQTEAVRWGFRWWV